MSRSDAQLRPTASSSGGDNQVGATSGYSTTTITPGSGTSSDSGFGEMDSISRVPEQQQALRERTRDGDLDEDERNFQTDAQSTYSARNPQTKRPFRRKFKPLFVKEGKLRPFRLLKQDVLNVKRRFIGDWTTFNQLIFASAVYVFFTNLLPGITFASDLYVRTGKSWGTIEIVFSTGLCGIIFSL
jgi:hypothetical protein